MGEINKDVALGKLIRRVTEELLGAARSHKERTILLCAATREFSTDEEGRGESADVELAVLKRGFSASQSCQ